jgi:hypothetical protein
LGEIFLRLGSESGPFLLARAWAREIENAPELGERLGGVGAERGQAAKAFIFGPLSPIPEPNAAARRIYRLFSVVSG